MTAIQQWLFGQSRKVTEVPPVILYPFVFEDSWPSGAPFGPVDMDGYTPQRGIPVPGVDVPENIGGPTYTAFEFGYDPLLGAVSEAGLTINTGGTFPAPQYAYELPDMQAHKCVLLTFIVNDFGATGAGTAHITTFIGAITLTLSATQIIVSVIGEPDSVFEVVPTPATPGVGYALACAPDGVALIQGPSEPGVVLGTFDGLTMGLYQPSEITVSASSVGADVVVMNTMTGFGTDDFDTLADLVAAIG